VALHDLELAFLDQVEGVSVLAFPDDGLSGYEPHGSQQCLDLGALLLCQALEQAVSGHSSAPERLSSGFARLLARVRQEHSSRARGNPRIR